MPGKEFKAQNGQSYTVECMDDFEYKDPIDNSVTSNQVRVRLSVPSKPTQIHSTASQLCNHNLPSQPVIYATCETF